MGRHDAPSSAPATPVAPRQQVPWASPEPLAPTRQVPWARPEPMREPLPPVPLPIAPPPPPPVGDGPAEAAPWGAPGTPAARHHVAGAPSARTRRSGSSVRVGGTLSVAGVLGLDADVGGSTPVSTFADLDVPAGSYPPAPKIPGQRQPVQSSGPLPSVRTVAPPAAPPPVSLGAGAPSVPAPAAPPPAPSPSPAEPPPAVPWSTASFPAPTASPWSTLPPTAVPPLTSAPITSAPHTSAPITRPARPNRPAAPPTPTQRTGTQRAVPSTRSAPRRPSPQPAPTPLPRLLAGWLDTGEPADLEQHLRRYGELPRAQFAGRRGAGQLLELIEDSGLRGRGGAGFPTARKMAAVLDAATARRRPVVVANGCEGDPTSTKDHLLLHTAPHLVLDGLALAAHTVGADQAILCLPRGSALVEPLEDAVARRIDDPAQVHVVTTPRRFVASQSSALVNFLTTGDARPTSSPPMPAERGVQGRPTLVDNVETLAHLGLLARHDADWFRARGTPDSPGTTLVTVGGAIRNPGVYEVDLGVRAGQLLQLAGGPADGSGGSPRAMLLGGLGGVWLPLPAGANVALAYHRPNSTQEGAALGLASLLVLPAEACGLAVTSAIVGYLAGESAGQCGPCMFGLPAVAGDLDALASGSARPELLERLRRRLGVIPGRGACAHPDGATRLAASALEVFAQDIAEHARGRPCGRAGTGTLPVLGELTSGERGWR